MVKTRLYDTPLLPAIVAALLRSLFFPNRLDVLQIRLVDIARNVLTVKTRSVVVFNGRIQLYDGVFKVL